MLKRLGLALPLKKYNEGKIMPLNWKNIPSKWHLTERWLNWLEKYDCWVVLNVSGYHPGPIAMMEPINDHSILLAQCFVGIKSTRTFFLHKSARNVRQSTLGSSSFSSTTDKHLGRNLWVVVEEKKTSFWCFVSAWTFDLTRLSEIWNYCFWHFQTFRTLTRCSRHFNSFLSCCFATSLNHW